MIHERMESQSISQDGSLWRWKASDSSHGASVKSRLAISGSDGCGGGGGGSGVEPVTLQKPATNTELSYLFDSMNSRYSFFIFTPEKVLIISLFLKN